MELNITRFVRANRDCMSNFSDSIANSGLQNIGQVTWRNAMTAMQDVSACLVPPAQCGELVDYFSEFGAWEREELEAMSCQELNAMLVQCIASDWQEYSAAKEQGRAHFKKWDENCGGRIYGNRGRYYYYVGM
jgi:hypothetical protein